MKELCEKLDMNLSEDSMLSCVQLLVLSRFISFVSSAVHFASAVAGALYSCVGI